MELWAEEVGRKKKLIEKEVEQKKKPGELENHEE